MPHIPRQQFGPAFPEIPKPSPPLQPPAVQTPQRPRAKLGLDRISLHTFEPDLDDVLESLYGDQVLDG